MVEIGIVSVCGNTMCYLNYREAEVQVLKRVNLVKVYEFIPTCWPLIKPLGSNSQQVDMKALLLTGKIH